MLMLIAVSFTAEAQWSVRGSYIKPVGEFGLYLEELTPESLYYFRAFIVEENVFAESEVDSFRVPLPEPPIPPCTLEEGVIMDGINVYDDLSSGTSDTYEGYVLIVYPANLTGGSFRFTFIDYPTSDVYTPSYELAACRRCADAARASKYCSEQGTKKEHSLSYVTDEQRSAE